LISPKLPEPNITKLPEQKIIKIPEQESVKPSEPKPVEPPEEVEKPEEGALVITGEVSVVP